VRAPDRDYSKLYLISHE